MAYSISQKPNTLAASNSSMVFVLTETTSAIYTADKFRYIAQIFITTSDTGSFTEIAKIKLHKNKANVGIVDINKIVTTYLETQQRNIGNQESIVGSIHSIGITDTSNSYSQAGDGTLETYQLIGVKVKGGYEKAADATSAPVETLDEDNTTIYSIPASTPFTDTGTNLGGLDVSGGNDPLNLFLPKDSTKKFLTNAPTVQFVRGGDAAGDNVDELTVGFINKGLVTSSDAVVRMYIEYYDSSDSIIGSAKYFINDTGSGGKATADDVKNSLLYFGCGTANLQNQVDEPNAQPSDFAGWAYYRIWGADGSGTQETKHYYFYRYGAAKTGIDDRHQSCTRNNNIRLAWINRLGCWDYMNFRGKSVESVDIKPSEMSRVPGTWDKATYSYDNWGGGRQVLFKEAKRKLTINSDWLNEDESAWIEELFTSINVHILADSQVVYPVIVVDKTYTKKTSLNNKIKIQYSLKLEYANQVRTNS